VTCPSGVDLKKVFVSMREQIAQKKGLYPTMEVVVASILENRNISDEDNAERGEWLEDLKDRPNHMYQKEKADVAYFVGCVASFFPMVQKIPQNLVKILDSAKVDFALLAGEEWCCGFPLIGAGAHKKMKELTVHNQERVNALGAKTVVFSCPSCYQTWKDYYQTDLELFHSTQLIERLIEDKAIRLKEFNSSVTYHDPCDLGRAGGVYDAPRRILRSIPGLNLIELDSNRAQSVCCGGGGNLEIADSNLSGSVAQKKIEEIRRTGVKTVVTSCQQCVRTIKSQARRQKVDLDVLDITELVTKAMSEA
jgi:heterodisulfide reductase subunit D